MCWFFGFKIVQDYIFEQMLRREKKVEDAKFFSQNPKLSLILYPNPVILPYLLVNIAKYNRVVLIIFV